MMHLSCFFDKKFGFAVSMAENIILRNEDQNGRNENQTED